MRPALYQRRWDGWYPRTSWPGRDGYLSWFSALTVAGQIMYCRFAWSENLLNPSYPLILILGCLHRQSDWAAHRFFGGHVWRLGEGILETPDCRHQHELRLLKVACHFHHIHRRHQESRIYQVHSWQNLIYLTELNVKMRITYVSGFFGHCEKNSMPKNSSH